MPINTLYVRLRVVLNNIISFEYNYITLALAANPYIQTHGNLEV